MLGFSCIHVFLSAKLRAQKVFPAGTNGAQKNNLRIA